MKQTRSYARGTCAARFRAFAVVISGLLASTAHSAPAMPPATQGGASSALHDETVVASRGGVDITLAEIDARIALMPADTRAGYMDSPKRIEQLILNLLLEKQLAQMGREAGLHEKRLFELQARQAVDNMLGKQAMEHHLANLRGPDYDALAHERYLADTKTYTLPERRDVTQILIKTDARDKDAAAALAAKVREEALAGVVPFEELVKRHNEGNPSNGKLEDVVRGQTVAPFEATVFAMEEPGEISEVIESRFGFHVVRLDRTTEESRVPFPAVRESLIAKVREDHLARENRKLRDELNSMKLDASPEAVASLRTRYLPANTPLGDYDTGTADTNTSTELDTDAGAAE